MFKATLSIGSALIIAYLWFANTLTFAFNMHYNESTIIGNTIIAILSIISLVLVNLIIWRKKKIKQIIAFILVCVIAFVSLKYVAYRDDKQRKLYYALNGNINILKYLPFDENSQIVQYKSEFQLTDNLPHLDGAAAVFPLYSAFINAVYPKYVELDGGVFSYNNTVMGYEKLAKKETDIFFGVKPSKEQLEYAKNHDTVFEYTVIGKEAFVFITDIKNPIDSLTTQQIKDIYSGKITNWKEVGGKDKPIVAYQRNNGSGSQSMMKRFMGDTPLMKAPTEQVNELMGGIITDVAGYKEDSKSIGYSFRYYTETLVNNPNIKIIKIDGIYPSDENIKNGTYPITVELVATTYRGNKNENVQKLINWILTEEGQKIIEETGYIPVK